MKTNMKSIYGILGAFVISGFSPAHAAPWTVLMQNPDARSAAVLDAIQYSLLTPEQFNGEWKTHNPQGPRVGYRLTLATASQIRAGLTPEMLRTHVVHIGTSGAPDCKNIFRCVGLAFDRSVIESVDLMTHIEKVIRQPCKYVPSSDREHWIGFRYPAYITFNYLNCGKWGVLPYGEVRIYIHTASSNPKQSPSYDLVKKIKIRNAKN